MFLYLLQIDVVQNVKKKKMNANENKQILK